MRNDIIVQKLLACSEKVIGHCAGVDYEMICPICATSFSKFKAKNHRQLKLSVIFKL